MISSIVIEYAEFELLPTSEKKMTQYSRLSVNPRLDPRKALQYGSKSMGGPVRDVHAPRLRISLDSRRLPPRFLRGLPTSEGGPGHGSTFNVQQSPRLFFKLDVRASFCCTITTHLFL